MRASARRRRRTCEHGGSAIGMDARRADVVPGVLAARLAVFEKDATCADRNWFMCKANPGRGPSCALLSRVPASVPADRESRPSHRRHGGGHRGECGKIDYTLRHNPSPPLSSRCSCVQLACFLGSLMSNFT